MKANVVRITKVANGFILDINCHSITTVHVATNKEEVINLINGVEFVKFDRLEAEANRSLGQGFGEPSNPGGLY